MQSADAPVPLSFCNFSYMSISIINTKIELKVNQMVASVARLPQSGYGSI